MSTPTANTPRFAADGQQDNAAAAGAAPSQEDRGCGAAGVVVACLVLVALGCAGLVSAASLERRGEAHHDTYAAAVVERKPRSDDRDYQFARLSNGIQVVNVLDSKAQSDAFSMAVDAGSLDDPASLPGLAHFCEHMLFLGTDSYPDPTSYDDFINRNGGKVNAYTEDEVTVYYAELSRGALDEGLDRFGDFFRAPRFNASLVEKEIHAIDSEHAKNRQDPSWRILALLESLANPRSPVSRFHTGDLETLSTRPQEAGADVVAALRAWFDRHYCPSRMHLVTFGSSPLKDQLAQAERHFGNISSKALTCEQQPPTSWASPPPWPPQHLGKWVSVLGTQPQAVLVLYFPLPDLTAEYRSQPTAYLDYVLSYGGEQSLLTVLRDDLGLVTDISVSSSTGSPGATLLVEFDLTEDGRRRSAGVLDVFFQYVGTLRHEEVSEELYESIAARRKLSWDWSEHQGAADTVKLLARRLARLPPERVLSGDTLVEAVDPHLIASLLKRLSPDNMNAALVDPSLDLASAPGARRLPHYGVQYAVGELAAEFPEALRRWRHWLTPHGAGHSGAALRAALQVPHLKAPLPPKAIRGVPRDLDTRRMRAVKERAADDGFDVALVGSRPRLLKAPSASQASQLWYRQGWATTSPKVQVKAAFRPPRRRSEWEQPALDAVRLVLYSSLFKRHLGPKVFDISAAGAGYDIVFSADGIMVSAEGFQPLLPGLLERISLEVRNGLNIKQVEFDRSVKELGESLRSYSEMPVDYAVFDLKVLLTASMQSKEEALEALSEVNASAVGSVVADVLLRSPLKLDALAMGNLDEEQARHAVSAVMTGVHSPASALGVDSAAKVLPVTPVVRPGRPVELRRKNPRAGDDNHVVVVTLLDGVGTVPSRVTLGLLGQMLGQLAYNELRTKQQLGYVVQAGETTISHVRGISTMVQGTSADADVMEAAVEKLYFEDMPEFLRRLEDGDFQSFRRSYRQQLLEPPLAYGEEFTHFWSPILTNTSCYQLRDEMVSFLDNELRAKRHLVDTWSRLTLPEGARRKVVVKYFAGKVPERPSKEKSSAAWRTSGISERGQRQLAREFDETVVVDRADSSTRAKLAQAGGHYPMHVECVLPDGMRRGGEGKAPHREAEGEVEAQDKAEADVGADAGGGPAAGSGPSPAAPDASAGDVGKASVSEARSAGGRRGPRPWNGAAAFLRAE